MSQTGPLLGLSMVVQLDQKNYMNGGQTEQAGARLVIHPNAQGYKVLNTLKCKITSFLCHCVSVPLIAEKGIDLQPNTLTQVAIQEHNITRLPSPYRSDCYDSWNQSDHSHVQNFHPQLTYSITVNRSRLLGY